MPPLPPVAEQPLEKEKAAEKIAKEQPAAKKEAAADEPAKAPQQEPAKPEIAAPAPAVPRRRVAMGSADPASGYAAVYYFDSQGTAVECVELNGKKYKSVEDYSGYLRQAESNPRQRRRSRGAASWARHAAAALAKAPVRPAGLHAAT